jgi:L-threonylcarbamoyladenylate synthase
MLCQMPTLVLTIADLAMPSAQSAIEQAARALRAGDLVAFPTETVYGLGANALDAVAVERIFAAKDRPAWDPLIVHVEGEAMLGTVAADVPSAAQALIAAFWPGPLTLLLPRTAAVPDAVTAGRPLVGVRSPRHPVARALIQAAGVPVAAPSANRFRHVSPTTAAHVLHDLDGRVDIVLNAGPADLGLESTVLDVSVHPPVLYRPGIIMREEIESVIGPIAVYRSPHNPAAEDGLGTPAGWPSPGMDFRHYAPGAPLILVDASASELPEALFDALVLSLAEEGDQRPGVLLPRNWSAPAEAIACEWGAWDDPAELARTLYSGLRWLDAQSVTGLYCPLPPEGPETAALRDRLIKASRSH